MEEVADAIIPDDFVRELAPWINFNTLFILELVKKNYGNGMLWQYVEDFDASQLTSTVTKLTKRFSKLRKRPIDRLEVLRRIVARIGPHLRRVRNFTADENDFGIMWPLAAPIAPQLRSLAITTPVTMPTEDTREVYEKLIFRLSPENVKILYLQHHSNYIGTEILPEIDRTLRSVGGSLVAFQLIADFSEEQAQNVVDIVGKNLTRAQHIDVPLPHATAEQLLQLTHNSRGTLKQFYVAPSPWESYSQQLSLWARVLSVNLKALRSSDLSIDLNERCISRLGLPLCGLRSKMVNSLKKLWEEYIEYKIFEAKRDEQEMQLGTPLSDRLFEACYPRTEEMIPDRAFALLSLSKTLQHYPQVAITDKVEWFSEKVEQLVQDAMQRWVVLVPAVVLLLFNVIDKPDKLFLSQKTGRNLRHDARQMLHDWIVKEPRIITLFPVLTSLPNFSFGPRPAFEDSKWAEALVMDCWDKNDFVTGTPLIFSFINNPHLLTPLIRSGKVDWLMQDWAGFSLVELAFVGGSVNSWVVVFGKTWPNFLTEKIIRHFRDRTILARLGEFVSLVESCHAAALEKEQRNLSLEVSTILWKDILENETSIETIKADVLGMLRAFDVSAQLLIDFVISGKPSDCKCVLSDQKMNDLLLAEVSGLKKVVEQQRGN